MGALPSAARSFERRVAGSRVAQIVSGRRRCWRFLSLAFWHYGGSFRGTTTSQLGWSQQFETRCNSLLTILVEPEAAG
jgi:hypothetical protein